MGVFMLVYVYVCVHIYAYAYVCLAVGTMPRWNVFLEAIRTNGCPRLLLNLF
jgi:hypothetical protein